MSLKVLFYNLGKDKRPFHDQMRGFQRARPLQVSDLLGLRKSSTLRRLWALLKSEGALTFPSPRQFIERLGPLSLTALVWPKRTMLT